MIPDILEEHLEEASWLHDVRARLLRSYEIDLDGLAEWDERWLAHVDGLVVGEACSRPIVEEGLHEDHEGTVCATAAVLACWGGDGERARLESVLRDPEFKHPVPLARGLGLAPSALHEKWLDGWIRSPEAPLRAAAAEVMRFRGIAPPVDVLRPLLRLDQQPSEVVRAALGLASDLKVPGCNACVEGALDSPDPRVKRAALEAMVKLGVRGARERWRATVRHAAARALPEDIEKLGVYGSAEDLQLLLGTLDDPHLAAAAVRALAWLGHPGAAEPLLVKMSNPGLGRIAGQAFSALFGADLKSDAQTAQSAGVAPAGERRESEEDTFEFEAYSELPQPDADAMADWWRKNAARFPGGTRLRHGRAYALSDSTEALLKGRLADRPTASLELGLGVKEAPFLEVEALVPAQLRRLGSLLPLRSQLRTGTSG